MPGAARSGLRVARGPVLASDAMKALRSLPLVLVAVAAVAACGGGGSGASFPGSSDVAAAQAKWCDALAKAVGGGASWEHLADCKSAASTGSPLYIRGMTKCFPARLEQLGKDAPDYTQILTECSDEVTVALQADEASAPELVGARCDRMARCEKVDGKECRAAFERLETAQKALLTTVYNAGAQHEIASCLGDKSCGDDEEGARESCYKPVSARLLYFP